MTFKLMMQTGPGDGEMTGRKGVRQANEKTTTKKKKKKSQRNQAHLCREGQANHHKAVLGLDVAGRQNFAVAHLQIDPEELHIGAPLGHHADLPSRGNAVQVSKGIRYKPSPQHTRTHTHTHTHTSDSHVNKRRHDARGCEWRRQPSTAGCRSPLQGCAGSTVSPAPPRRGGPCACGTRRSCSRRQR